MATDQRQSDAALSEVDWTHLVPRFVHYRDQFEQLHISNSAELADSACTSTSNDQETVMILNAYSAVSPAAATLVQQHAWAQSSASKLPSIVSSLFGDQACSELSVDEDLPDRLLVTIHVGVPIKSWKETYRSLLGAWSQSADPEARRKVLFNVESA